jgi:hypothetical protein
MPYIRQPVRDWLAGGGDPTTVGDLNYIITTTLLNFVRAIPADIDYTTINAVIGVLECAKMELYRRVAVPYEERKRAENGDVFP